MESFNKVTFVSLLKNKAQQIRLIWSTEHPRPAIKKPLINHQSLHRGSQSTCLWSTFTALKLLKLWIPRISSRSSWHIFFKVKWKAWQQRLYFSFPLYPSRVYLLGLVWQLTEPNIFIQFVTWPCYLTMRFMCDDWKMMKYFFSFQYWFVVQ